MEDDATSTSRPSTKGKGGLPGSNEPATEDLLNFNTWNLGNGKLKDKRVKLDQFISQLMDRNNKKLRQQHDAHCSKFWFTKCPVTLFESNPVVALLVQFV